MFDKILPWILSFGGIAVLAGLIALNPVLALKLAKDIGAFFLEKARAFAKWARDPNRNWWKIGCMSFAAAFGIAAFYARDQQKEVIFVTETLTQEIHTCRLASAEIETKATNHYNNLLTCQGLMAKMAGEDQDTDAINAAAVARAEAAQRKAEQELKDWKNRHRTAECKDALKVLEEKCATFSDY